MTHTGAYRIALAAIATVALALASNPIPSTAQGNVPGQLLLSATKPSGKLTYRLQALAESSSLRAASAAAQAEALSLPAEGPGSLLKDASGRLLVYVRMNDLSAPAVQALADTGAQIVHVSQSYETVTVYVDAADLSRLSALPAVRSIREEFTPNRSGDLGGLRNLASASSRANAPEACGAQTSEGDTQLNAATARTAFGVDGSGIKVGVISDSYDRSATAIGSAAIDVSTGDLPGPGNPCGRFTPVAVISDSISTNTIDEGRAMAQIVHDLAPGATIGFGTAWNGLYAFADNVRALRAWGATVIVDDIYYFDEPFFQDGPVSVAIRDVVNAGASYFTSAGNHSYPLGVNNIASYEAPAFRPTTCPAGLPVWVGTNCHDFNPTATTDNASSITLQHGGYVQFIFQWAEPWFGLTTDFDIFLLNSADTVVAYSAYINSSDGEPFEFFSYQNLTGVTQTYRLVINRYSGGTPRLKYYLNQSSFGVTFVEYPVSSGGDIVGPTIAGHSASPHSLSVAAAPYNNNNAPETFSSWGPAAHYFGPVVNAIPAAPIAPLVLQQPDFTATDGGCNTFFGSISGGCHRFFGTSAAAPHAAAVAALMKQKAAQRVTVLNQASVKSILKSTASSMSGGTVNSVGSGLINAHAAVNATSLLPRTLMKNVYLPITLK